MKTIRNLIPLATLLAMAQCASAAVPAAINYQGRLTNAAGVPQPGTRTMSLKIYDAANAGTPLYAESLGSVAVDANGVYSFQFGATGTSDTLITETLATTDGTSLTYQKTLANTPVLAGTASVTDGTYSWNETTGNPGSPAAATASIISGFVVGATVTQGGSGYTSPPAVTITGNGTGAAATATVSSGGVSGITITNAGSGYTTGATISIAPPPAPFIVNYSGGAITATYASAPAAGQTITATYRYSANGISSALAAGAEQWLELSVDGIAQSSRQKVLAVPFAMNASSSLTAERILSIDESLLSVRTDTLSRLIDEVALYGSSANSYRTGFNLVEPSTLQLRPNSSTYTTRTLSRSASFTAGGGLTANPVNGPISNITVSALTNGQINTGNVDYYFQYLDGTSYYAGYADAQSVSVAWPKTLNNPNPEKPVLALLVSAQRDYSSSFSVVYNSSQERWMDMNLLDLPVGVLAIRCLATGILSAGSDLQACLEWSVLYTDGSLSGHVSVDSQVALAGGKVPKAVRIYTVPSQLGGRDMDITKILIRLISK